MRRFAESRPLTAFFLLAIGLGWLVALPMVLSPGGLGVIPVEVPELWLAVVALTPTIAALWVQWLREGNFRITTLGRPWPRVLLGSIAGGLIALLAMAVIPALVLSNGAVGALGWSAIISASIPWWSNPLNLLGGPLTEEPGWRGFALPRLQSRFGALPGSLVLGLLWALWHLPLFFIQGWLSVPVWAFVILVVCLSILMTWAVNLARGSIVPAVLMHAVYNSSFPILVGLCRGVPTRDPGLVWYVVGVVMATGLAVAVSRGRLGQPVAVSGER